MKDYRQLIRELPSKTVVLACGKFNPPTVGHELLVKTVKKLAEQKNADHIIYTSNAVDGKKNPLIIEKKLGYLNSLFPNTKFVESSESIADLVKDLRKSYNKVVLVVNENTTVKKSLGVEVISVGGKDPDSDEVTRTLAVKGLYEDFKKNLPSTIREIDSRRLMNDIRIGSGLEPIKEQINLVKDELREQYFRGEIFNVGDIVESNGQQYEIVKRGSNHLLLKEESGKLVSKWIQDVTVVEDAVNTKSTYNAAKDVLRYKDFKKLMKLNKEDMYKPDIEPEVSSIAHANERINNVSFPKVKKAKKVGV